ncbi:YrhC family protein [Ectobacillus ponti]|uniref:YrhC family protein n=1 Tax=Ectobacillus ponti TaxID=2961894 RepID=A0AA41X1J6_9BACI|nr:YrhC family protein [Ectobacillus ponti]MCP8967251.1 YrhC family protein [Ectobacillus ponti]
MKTARELQQKHADYVRFGQVLLAVGAFLMIGLLLPNHDKQALQIYAMMVAITGFLGASFFFFRRAKLAQQQAEEIEYEQG